MLTILQKSIDDLRKDFNKEIDLKKSHSELKNRVSGMKYKMERMNNRWMQVEETMRGNSKRGKQQS